ncbi:hypothetical protein EFV37_20835 [Mesorhizobium loti]|uniref:Uncharacterized protein n=1 Tax=Mesorhizobium jarvisii TaxID=1777867 RepID=A0A6M7TI24_9HYPH|nr:MULTISPECIES: hypothetical protein [Mesorhizobium]OBQ64312.1 hypothetical protein A9K72_17550 [Mesorhizobium loti]QKC64460.1 hypothetical protein EB229_20830 [Mesorhizobium jarvisii]QKD10374.1 hypothetical protein EFV37_20835 [Mesorhizobium loti]RJT37014.1 hypothetical protein D3242_06795 [Mesorhizobium jarvisii]
MSSYARALIGAAFISTVAGCGNPRFDVPYDQYGPDATAIDGRIQCELAEMLMDKNFNMLAALRDGHYQVAGALSLDITNTIGAEPSFNGMWPTTGGMFSFNVGANLTRAHERSMTAALAYSMDDIQRKIDTGKYEFECPKRNINGLSGNLGLKELVQGAMPLQLDQKAGISPGQFGGAISFTVTANVNAVGPTWAIANFNGPGKFAKVGNVYLDKLTIAFAQTKPDEVKKGAPTAKGTAKAKEDAREYLRNVQAQELSNQISNLNNKF